MATAFLRARILSVASMSLRMSEVLGTAVPYASSACMSHAAGGLGTSQSATVCRALMDVTAWPVRGFAAQARAANGAALHRKLKHYSSYKERFRMSASGGIKFMRPGHRHKRFVKSPKRNAALRKGAMLHEAYAKVMRQLGFKRNAF